MESVVQRSEVAISVMHHCWDIEGGVVSDDLCLRIKKRLDPAGGGLPDQAAVVLGSEVVKLQMYVPVIHLPSLAVWPFVRPLAALRLLPRYVS